MIINGVHHPFVIFRNLKTNFPETNIFHKPRLQAGKMTIFLSLMPCTQIDIVLALCEKFCPVTRTKIACCTLSEEWLRCACGMRAVAVQIKTLQKATDISRPVTQQSPSPYSYLLHLAADQNAADCWTKIKQKMMSGSCIDMQYAICIRHWTCIVQCLVHVTCNMLFCTMPCCCTHFIGCKVAEQSPALCALCAQSVCIVHMAQPRGVKEIKKINFSHYYMWHTNKKNYVIHTHNTSIYTIHNNKLSAGRFRNSL